MKLSPRDAPRFFDKPDPAIRAVLIYGPDQMRVRDRRRQLVTALVGPDSEAEMRFTRIAAASLRGDKAALGDALRARGFFPGPRAVLVEDATDAISPVLDDILDDISMDDAVLVITAGQLNARSKLRVIFEKSPHAAAAPVYADPPTRDEIEQAVRAAGIGMTDQTALQTLTDLGRALEPGDFRMMLEKLSLYKIGDNAPLTDKDIATCAPGTIEEDQDELYNLAAEGAVDRVGDVLPRLSAQGANPTGLCIGAQRHFRQLHAAAIHPQGPETGLSRARPPIFGPRKDRMVRQARHWGSARLETVLGLILETDLALRSPRPVPDAALVERMFIRIAMMHTR